MKARWQLLLILAVAFGTPIAATLLFYYAPPRGTTNAGEFVDPTPLPAGLLPAAAADGASWYLMSVADAECGEQCRRRLCAMHQVRLINLRDFDRVGKLWLVLGPGAPPAALEMDSGCGADLPAAEVVSEQVDVLSGTEQISVDAQALAALPVAAATAHNYIYVIDPQGRLMMRYGDSLQVKDIAKDMRRLLRLSRRR